MGVAVGSGYLYETTFEKEVYSDLYGERGCLMGGIHGMFLAQYEVLREAGHSPSEAFNETVEEATLARPAGTWMQRGGRTGRHSEHLGFLLAEMQHLQRSHPGAAW